MGRVTASAAFAAGAHQAERLWYEAARWPDFIDGLARVISVTEPWPEVGGSVSWESGPAGRGRVSERAVAYEQGSGQTVEVEDQSISGIQTVEFRPAGDGVEVALTLDYRIKRRSPATPLVDLLFVRRLMLRSLERTLSRFAFVLDEDTR